jgi:hypothetical protein
MHSWSIFGARTSHVQTQIHKTHHGPDLREVNTFPLIIYSVAGHKTNTQVGVPKFSQLRLSRFWGPITLRVNLQLK